MTFHYYKDHTGQWRWYLQATNGNMIAEAGEGYHSREDCVQAIELVRSSSKATVIESPPLVKH